MKRPDPFPISAAAPIESPCIGVCTLDERHLCVGCRRSTDEITRWLELSAAERRSIMDELASRD